MTSSIQVTRRSLLAGGAIAGTLSALSPLAQASHHNSQNKNQLISKGKIILIQGDSITDAGRDKKNEVPNKQKSFGKGYAWMAASQLLTSKPESIFEVCLHNSIL